MLDLGGKIELFLTEDRNDGLNLILLEVGSIEIADVCDG